jgi:CRISPR-associated protein Csm1
MTIDELRGLIESLAAGLRADTNDLRRKNNEILRRCGDDLLLVKGDLSGIQRYLYRVNAAEDTDGGVAKRLRGRSFFLSAICHAFTNELMRYAGFDPRRHHTTLLAAGGKFLVALPYSGEIARRISDWKKEIDEWLWEEAWNELSLNLAWHRCSQKDLRENFSRKAALPLQESLDKNALNKFLPLLRGGIEKSEKGWHSFPLYKESYADECHSCKHLPVKTTEIEKNLCEVCLRLQKLGGYLSSFDRCFLDFRNEKVDEKPSIVNFHKNHAILKESSPTSLPNIAAFVPRWPYHGFDRVETAEGGINGQVNDKKNALCVRCSLAPEKQDQECGEDRLATRFHCLATVARIKDGADRIAVMAADGDDFSYHLNSTPGITLEDQVVLGNLIYRFFGDHLIELLREHNGLMVYSGGDDFVIVGPWAQVIRIAQRLRHDFTNWTNGKLHFSAGVYITNPKEPIFESISQAQRYLEKAKEEPGKNAIQIGSTCIPWLRFDAVFKLANDLADAENSGVISMAFIYGLYSICEDYERYKKKGEIIGLRYLSRLAAHVSRNLKLDWRGDVEKTRLAERLRQSFENQLLNPKDETLLPYWRFALDWAALKGRGA